MARSLVGTCRCRKRLRLQEGAAGIAWQGLDRRMRKASLAFLDWLKPSRYPYLLLQSYFSGTQHLLALASICGIS